MEGTTEGDPLELDNRRCIVAYAGWDYSELLKELGFDEDGIQKLGTFLADHYDGEYDAEGQHAIAEMKAYLEALCRRDGYDKVVFKALLLVEDDWTFVQLYLDLIHRMWD
jgi:hypothetical protein